MSPAPMANMHGCGSPADERPRTLRNRHVSLELLDEGRRLYPTPEGVERPRTRGDCVAGPRPCPFAGCKYHLYLDVNEDNGDIRFHFPKLEVEEMNETCALDIADEGGVSLERVGNALNVTRERVRQMEHAFVMRLVRTATRRGLKDFHR